MGFAEQTTGLGISFSKGKTQTVLDTHCPPIDRLVSEGRSININDYSIV
jgi:hypothetical protein